jgi:hypothetical protein
MECNRFTNTASSGEAGLTSLYVILMELCHDVWCQSGAPPDLSVSRDVSHAAN